MAKWMRSIVQGAVDDLVLLNDLSEEAIVSNLQNTFAKNSIYTSIGPVLLSVNPFQNIDGLYTPTLAAKYRRKQQGELAPHVFAVAEAAWKALLSLAVRPQVHVKVSALFRLSAGGKALSPV